MRYLFRQRYEYSKMGIPIFTNFSSLTAPEVDKMTISCAASVEIVIKITFPFHCTDDTAYDFFLRKTHLCRTSTTYRAIWSGLSVLTKPRFICSPCGPLWTNPKQMTNLLYRWLSVKIGVTPSLTHWSYVFALTHRYRLWHRAPICIITELVCWVPFTNMV